MGSPLKCNHPTVLYTHACSSQSGDVAICPVEAALIKWLKTNDKSEAAATQGIWLSLGAEQSPHTERSTASHEAAQVCTTPSPADSAQRRLADAFGGQPKLAHSSIKASRRTHTAPSLLQQPWLLLPALCARLATGSVLQTSPEQPFHWTAPTVVLAVVLCLVAGLCEIGGGWLVWQVYTLPLTQPCSFLALSTISSMDAASPGSGASLTSISTNKN